MNESLYFNEEQVVAQAEELCRDFSFRSGEALEHLQSLICAYRKSFREQQRLVRFSDRQQEQLRNVTQELQEKTFQLQRLNDLLEAEINIKTQLESELRLMATTDAMTGAVNRRRFHELGDYEQRRMERRQNPLSVIMLDLDRFKEVNDRLGHAAGDEALRSFSRICRENLRAVDTLGRLGGDEFGVLLPETDLRAAVEVAERIRAAVAACKIKGTKDFFSVTSSIGVAEMCDNELFEKLLARADAAMYASKQGGRNRVESSEEDSL